MTEKNKKDECPIKIEQLDEYFNICKTQYGPIHKKMRLLDATDAGELWKAIGAKFPPYQILPDTNFVAYVKNNILASLYTVVKSASLVPTSEQDKDLVYNLNLALEYVWGTEDIGYRQFQAGERAALLNLGVTQVGWDNTVTGGSKEDFHQGNVTVRNIDPIKFMRDPFAISLETSGYCMTYDDFHKSVFRKNPKYKEKFELFEAKEREADTLDTPKYRHQQTPTKDYYTLVVFWVKHGDDMYEIHTVNCKEILYWKKIKPAIFPFALLYCNEPAGKLVGSSPVAQIFANNVAYNLMDSIALTAELKNQRPPKFISSESGLNIDAFSKHGDEADRTFVVRGDATRAVHYHQFPYVSPSLPALKESLQLGMETVSGVDGRYTGRDTGSIITTGGTEEMLNRVTMIDTPKITLYEAYTKQLTKLVLLNLLEFAPERTYYVQEPNSPKHKTIKVPFQDIDKKIVFNYDINISSELPKNKQRIAQMANMLMEKQMQYQESGSSVQLITEEEWLMMQDLPMKEYMLERMGIQRQRDSIEEVSQVLFNYADLIQKGMSPDDAIMATASGLDQKRRGAMMEQGPIPAVGMENPMGTPPEMDGII